jgi:flavin reductase (DIM6/NTAB) family NADH-FMN oxidoreductase RutF
MRHIDPDTIPHSESHRYLLTCVAPRPIAFAGTMDADGRPNLAPFSFFNAFGANPPVVAFSPAFRGVDGTPKHTLLNILETKEFTISVVSYSMVEQVSLASSDFPEGVDEFVKAGFTKLPSTKIRPFGVAESPMVMECRLLHHISLGGKAASGNLLVGEVVMFHIRDSVFDGKYPNADRLDLVGRMGGPLYCRASGGAIFTLAKPTHVGVGFDALPEAVRESMILTGNDLAKLAGVERLPEEEIVQGFWAERFPGAEEIISDDVELELRMGDPGRAITAMTVVYPGVRPSEWPVDLLHRIAQAFIRRGEVSEAWCCLLTGE